MRKVKVDKILATSEKFSVILDDGSELVGIEAVEVATNAGPFGVINVRYNIEGFIYISGPNPES